jgi:hypothetical protein
MNFFSASLASTIDLNAVIATDVVFGAWVIGIWALVLRRTFKLYMKDAGDIPTALRGQRSCLVQSCGALIVATIIAGREVTRGFERDFPCFLINAALLWAVTSRPLIKLIRAQRAIVLFDPIKRKFRRKRYTWRRISVLLLGVGVSVAVTATLLSLLKVERYLCWSM